VHHGSEAGCRTDNVTVRLSTRDHRVKAARRPRDGGRRRESVRRARRRWLLVPTLAAPVAAAVAPGGGAAATAAALGCFLIAAIAVAAQVFAPEPTAARGSLA
jgi:hypothetical protein